MFCKICEFYFYVSLFKEALLQAATSLKMGNVTFDIEKSPKDARKFRAVNVYIA